MRNIVLIFLAVVIGVSGCRKKTDPVPPQIIDTGGVVVSDGHVQISFENMVGSQALQLSTQTYTNEAGNTFIVTTYKYYISNIRLWRADSTYYSEPESYHLINEELSNSKSFIMHEVPGGEYTGISFMIGVDSARNASGAQTGALDPANAMFWDWDTGYIMAKLEGTSPSASKPISFHMGGFRGKFNVLRSVNLGMPEAAIVSRTKTPQIHIKSDVLEWFKTPTTINFATDNLAMGGSLAAMIAGNYIDMFTVVHVENK